MVLFCDAREATRQYGRYVDDVRRLLVFHAVSCGEAENFLALAAKLAESKAFRTDLAALSRSIRDLEQGAMSADEMLNLIAVASGGEELIEAREDSLEISRTVEMLRMFLSGMGEWRETDESGFRGHSGMDDHKSFCLEDGTQISPGGGGLEDQLPGYFVASEHDSAFSASKETPAMTQVQGTPRHLDLAITEIKLYLDDIDRRLGRLEPRLEDIIVQTSAGLYQQPPQTTQRSKVSAAGQDVIPALSLLTRANAASGRVLRRALTVILRPETGPAKSMVDSLNSTRIEEAKTDLVTERRGMKGLTASDRKFLIVGAVFLLLVGVGVFGRYLSNHRGTRGPEKNGSASNGASADAGLARSNVEETPENAEHGRNPGEIAVRDLGAAEEAFVGKTGTAKAIVSPRGKVAAMRLKADGKEPRLEELRTSRKALPKESTRTALTPDTGTQSEVSPHKRLVSSKKPVYPTDALRQHTQGTVVLDAFIAKNGTVRRMDVVGGSSVFVNSAVAAVSWRRYRPYLVHGRPVEVETQITMNYPMH